MKAHKTTCTITALRKFHETIFQGLVVWVLTSPGTPSSCISIDLGYMKAIGNTKNLFLEASFK